MASFLSLRGGKADGGGNRWRRLALMEKQLAEGTPGEGDVILPPKAVAEAEKLCALGADKAGADRNSSRRSRWRNPFKSPCQTGARPSSWWDLAHLQAGGRQLIPNYRQVIPTAFASSVIIPREDFSSVLNRVAMVVTENSATVRSIWKMPR